MNNSVFGELVFNVGWKTKTDICLFDRNYNVIVKAAAYFEKDGVTFEQEAAFDDFNDNKNERLRMIEKLLFSFDNDKSSERFTPRILLFQRDGSYALLLDDKEDEDGGIAVCLKPTTEVISQDEYL